MTQKKKLTANLISVMKYKCSRNRRTWRVLAKGVSWESILCNRPDLRKIIEGESKEQRPEIGEETENGRETTDREKRRGKEERPARTRERKSVRVRVKRKRGEGGWGTKQSSLYTAAPGSYLAGNGRRWEYKLLLHWEEPSRIVCKPTFLNFF